MDHVCEKRWVSHCRYPRWAFTLTVSRNGGQTQSDAPVPGALAAAPHHLAHWRHREVKQGLGGNLLKNPKAGEIYYK